MKDPLNPVAFAAVTKPDGGLPTELEVHTLWLGCETVDEEHGSYQGPLQFWEWRFLRRLGFLDTGRGSLLITITSP
jgi:hypothetical protein